MNQTFKISALAKLLLGLWAIIFVYMFNTLSQAVIFWFGLVTVPVLLYFAIAPIIDFFVNVHFEVLKKDLKEWGFTFDRLVTDEEIKGVKRLYFDLPKGNEGYLAISGITAEEILVFERKTKKWAQFKK